MRSKRPEVARYFQRRDVRGELLAFGALHRRIQVHEAFAQVLRRSRAARETLDRFTPVNGQGLTPGELARLLVGIAGGERWRLEFAGEAMVNARQHPGD